MPKIFEGDLSVSNSFLKVDLGKIRSNYRKIKDRVGKGVKIASVLKSNAYGLGIYYVAPIIMESGCRDIFVTYVSEARIIKKIAKEKGISDMNIYLLSPAVHENLENVLGEGFIPVIKTIEEVGYLISYAHRNCVKPACVLKFDTGMNRFGIKPYEFNKLLSLNPVKHLDVKYTMSHMSSANFLDNAFNEVQFQNMLEIKKFFEDTPVTFGNSYSIFFDRALQFDMVRIGRLLYGETDSLLNNQSYDDIGLEPVFEIYSRVLQIKNITKGEAVGYGASYVADRKMKIAIVGIGYAEGYHTFCKNKSWFIINGKKAPVVGGVSMEYTMCDITDIDGVSEGTEVTIVGDGITLNEMASTIKVGALELINHFFSTMKNKIYFDGVKEIEHVKTIY